MEDRDKQRLLEFIKQESHIKERWQVVEWFEEERKRFEDEKQHLLEMCEKLDKEYAEKAQLLEQMREQLIVLEQSFREIERKETEGRDRHKERETHNQQLLSHNAELESNIEELKKEKKQLDLDVQSLRAEYMVRQNALKAIKDRRNWLLESAAESNIYEAMPLRQVEVMGKGGKVIKATPVKNYYERAIFSIKSDDTRSEQELHDEIERLQERMMALEIENGTLSIENKELRSEIAANERSNKHVLSRNIIDKTQILVTPSTPKEPIEHCIEETEDKQPQANLIEPDDMGVPEVEDKIAHLGEPVETNNFKESGQSESYEALDDESFGIPKPKKPLLEDIRIIVPKSREKNV